ncbi:MAG TPA: hypothetical protein DEH78_30525 [Solibacterales bacterium]|nr:hypothetical protein [Bryobacterales bacterium]
MSTILHALALIAVLAVPRVCAQTGYQAPNLKLELFGGFSTAPMEPGRANGEGLSRVRLNGWTASVTSYQVFRRWGLTAEVSGHSRNKDGLDVSTQTFLFGGTYRSFERKRFALTGRILAGVNRWDPASIPPGGYLTQNSFTFAFGQSVDIKLAEQFAIRVQPGLAFIRRTEAGGDRKLTLMTPLSVGVAFKFGKR